MSDDLVNFERIVRSRRSVRAFRPDRVETAVIERVAGLAGAAPSSCNTQPWSLHIVSGARLERLRDALVEAASGGRAAAPEVALAAPYEGVHRARQVEAAVNLFRAHGVARDDREARRASFLRNYALFDAPHAAFVFMSAGGGLREAADCGKFIQTFLLGLASAGLGACPQGSLCHYPDLVRQALDVDEPGLLLLGISFGHADDADPAAAVPSTRSDLPEFCRFHA